MTKSEELNMLMAKYPEASPIVILKISLAVNGAVFSRAALERVQQRDLRFSKGNPYGLSFDIQKESFFLPGPVIFRDASTLFVNYGEPYEDPYIFDYDSENDVFLVMDGSKAIDVIDFVPRPLFFDKITSKGTPMADVGGTGSAQRLLFNSYQRCRLWEKGLQCHYCALFTSNSYIREVDPGDAKETLAEALKEPGRFSEISVSGGMDFEDDFKIEVDRYIRFLEALSRDMDGHFNLQLLAPAYKKEDLKRLYLETGIGSYRANIEIWDKNTFKRMCPGKEKFIGYETWLDRLRDAVDILGKGGVYTTIVCGAELAKPGGLSSANEAYASNMEYASFMCENGIYPQAAIWRPHKNERLGWQRMQSVEYYLKNAIGIHNIRKQYFDFSLGCFSRGGDCTDSDLVKADPAEKINVKNGISDYKTCPEEYVPLEFGDDILKLLKRKDAEALIEAGEEAGQKKYLRAPYLFSPDNKRLILPLISDMDALSAYLVKTIWFKKPLDIVIKTPDACIKFKGFAYKYHVVGDVFRRALEFIRSEMPGTDMAAACEIRFLYAEGKTRAGSCVIMDNPAGQTMLHLDMQRK